MTAMTETLEEYYQKIAEGICPVCGWELEHEGGCARCPLCGWSACSND